MPSLTFTIPHSMLTGLNEAAQKRDTTLENLVGNALSDYLQAFHHGLFQISTSGALVEGVYGGAISSKELLKHGDLGLGTFADLNGEMVVLEGQIYQITADGNIEHRQDEFQVPFATVASFAPDHRFQSGAVDCLDDLKKVCDKHRESDNLFYMMRADGFFTNMHTRAVKASTGKSTLVEASQSQAEFHFTDVEGTLVCIWSPMYSRAFSVPGYHFHFLSKDRTKGGHVLDCKAKVLDLAIQMLFEYNVQLPEAGNFLTADLTKDTAAALAQAE